MLARDHGFLGRGWSFPPTFHHFDRSVEMVGGEDDIQQCIYLLLSISPGERHMLPQFGCNLAQFVFVALDTSVCTMIATEVRSALLAYEPRIDVSQVTVAPAADSHRNQILISIDYVVRSTNRRYNLVYPFYQNEDTGITR